MHLYKTRLHLITVFKQKRCIRTVINEASEWSDLGQQLVWARGLIREKCFCRDSWNVMSDVLLLLECTPRVAWAVLFQQRIHQALHVCSIKLTGHSPVFVNMLVDMRCWDFRDFLFKFPQQGLLCSVYTETM